MLASKPMSGLLLVATMGRGGARGVRGAGIAGPPSMRAPPVGVEAGVEADVGAVVGGDDGAGAVTQVDGIGAGFVAGLGGVWLYPDPLEAVLRVGCGAPAGDAPRFVAVAHRRILLAAGRLATGLSAPGGPSAAKRRRAMGCS